jgi:hypothetical protein
MKKISLSVLILVNIFLNINAQEAIEGNFEFKLNYGNFGGGINIFSNKYNFELTASLINLFLEYDKTNIGFEITPLKYIGNYFVDSKENYSVDLTGWNQNLYFLNGNLYWNPFDINNIILGPFVSINYLSVKNWSSFNAYDYVFSSGIRFLLRTYIEDWKYPFHIIGSEIGYKNISGRHSFYFNVNFDISILVGIIVAGLSGEASDVIEANEDYERQINGTGPFVPKEPKQPKLPFQNDKEIE